MDLITDRKSRNPGIATSLSNPTAVLQKANDATEKEFQAENIEAQQNILMESMIVLHTHVNSSRPRRYTTG
jgi:hypothetical protein